MKYVFRFYKNPQLKLIEIKIGQQSSQLAFLYFDPVPGKFLLKNALFNRKISADNIFKLVYLTEIQRN